MSAERLLRSVVEWLNASGIPYMLTGSVASAFHGAGRATMDVDLVVDPQAAQLTDLLARIASSGAYVSEDAAFEALLHRTMFNVVDTESGWKADLIVRKHRPFSETEFARRTAVDYFGVRLEIASVEDVILSKLESAKLGGSARQLEDVRALIDLNRDTLDYEYLRKWVAALGISAQWSIATA